MSHIRSAHCSATYSNNAKRGAYTDATASPPTTSLKALYYRASIGHSRLGFQHFCYTFVILLLCLLQIAPLLAAVTAPDYNGKEELRLNVVKALLKHGALVNQQDSQVKESEASLFFHTGPAFMVWNSQ